MKPTLWLTLSFALAAGALLTASPLLIETTASAKLAKPTPGQVEFQNMGFGLFVHWSPSVYQGTEGVYKNSPQGWHEALMPAAVTGRFVKLVFPVVAINGPCMAAAEMEILTN